MATACRRVEPQPVQNPLDLASVPAVGCHKAGNEWSNRRMRPSFFFRAFLIFSCTWPGMAARAIPADRRPYDATRSLNRA
jgi:hypothetical protein